MKSIVAMGLCLFLSIFIIGGVSLVTSKSEKDRFGGIMILSVIGGFLLIWFITCCCFSNEKTKKTERRVNEVEMDKF